MPTRHLAPLAEALSFRFRVLVCALPGYEGSPRLAEPYSLEEASERLEAALIERGVQRLALVGLSLGGYRALLLALRARVKVERAVLLGGFATVDTGGRAAFRDVAEQLRRGVDLADAIMSGAVAPAFLARYPDAIGDLRTWFDSAAPGVLAAELDAIARSENLRPRLPTLTIPILARVGELDRTAPVARSQEIVSAVPGSALQVIPGCGHMPLLEDERATIAATLEFLTTSHPSS